SRPGVAQRLQRSWERFDFARHRIPSPSKGVMSIHGMMDAAHTFSKPFALNRSHTTASAPVSRALSHLGSAPLLLTGYTYQEMITMQASLHSLPPDCPHSPHER